MIRTKKKKPSIYNKQRCLAVVVNISS